MKKLFTALIICFISFVMLISFWSSYELQDGYRLQGHFGSHGQIYKGYFDLVIDGEVMGVQGSSNGYIFGWVAKDPPNKEAPIDYFILNTQVGSVEWFSSDDYFKKLREYGCPESDMNKEINLAGFKHNRTFHRN